MKRFFSSAWPREMGLGTPWIMSMALMVLVALDVRSAEIPESVDVLVAGGTTAAVETACAAKAAGKSVFIVSPRPYFGEETGGRFELEPIPAADEPVVIRFRWTPSADGGKTRTSIVLDRPTEVTRLEVVTHEEGPARTRECHFICRGDDGQLPALRRGLAEGARRGGGRLQGRAARSHRQAAREA